MEVSETFSRTYFGPSPYEPAETLSSVAKKIIAVVLSVFASITSFTILPLPISIIFSAIVISASLAYAFPNSTHTPGPLDRPFHGSISPWYHYYIPTFPRISNWISRPVSFLRPYFRSHAPVGTGAHSRLLRSPPAITVVPPFGAAPFFAPSYGAYDPRIQSALGQSEAFYPSAPPPYEEATGVSHHQVRGGAPSGDGYSPLTRFAAPGGDSTGPAHLPVHRFPGGDGSGHAPVGDGRPKR